MASNIDIVFLNGSNYVVWEPYMENLLKIKELWKYMKIVIPDPTYDHTKFVFDGKKDEAIGVIKTYISQDIRFHISGIDFPHQV
jgi:hypothetical protein